MSQESKQTSAGQADAKHSGGKGTVSQEQQGKSDKDDEKKEFDPSSDTMSLWSGTVPI